MMALVVAGMLTQAAAPPPPASRPIRLAVAAWRDAWERRDISAFLACYSETYRAEGQNRAAFGARKREVFARAGAIAIGIEDLEIGVTGATASVSFRQVYSSDHHRDAGRKRLRFAREADRWLIVDESFTPER